MKAARDKAVSALSDAIPIIEKTGDEQMAAKKYAEAMATYEQGIKAAMLMSAARNNQQLVPEAASLLHKVNEAAKAANTPDATFKLLNDVIGAYPDDKTANMELAQVYLSKTPPDYDSAADLEERANAPDDEVRKLRDLAKKHRKK
jgi:hypothetical protein